MGIFWLASQLTNWRRIALCTVGHDRTRMELNPRDAAVLLDTDGSNGTRLDSIRADTPSAKTPSGDTLFAE
jgi:hypothetical protein